MSGGRPGGPDGGLDGGAPPRRTLASRRLRRLLGAVLAGAAGLLAGAVWRGYPPELAVVTGVALGALVFAVLGTVERMRSLR